MMAALFVIEGAPSPVVFNPVGRVNQVFFQVNIYPAENVYYVDKGVHIYNDIIVYFQPCNIRQGFGEVFRTVDTVESIYFSPPVVEIPGNTYQGYAARIFI